MNARPRIAATPPRMTADEFFAWAEEQPEGRFELVDGEVVAMAPEREGHVHAKGEAFAALREGIRARGLPCRAYTDGMSVRVSDEAVYEPDASVRCGPRLPRDVMEMSDPVIVVEVLSPSTARVDTGKKLSGYFSLASLRHYLVLDAEARTAIHYRRGEDGAVGMRLLSADGPEGGELTLDPPGIALALAELFDEP